MACFVLVNQGYMSLLALALSCTNFCKVVSYVLLQKTVINIHLSICES